MLLEVPDDPIDILAVTSGPSGSGMRLVLIQKHRQAGPGLKE